MRGTSREVARESLRAYRDAPALARAHLRVRWVSCPFSEVAALMPQEGSILDVGCGHGLLSTYLALGSFRRRVLGIDIDLSKINVAKDAALRAGARGATLEFQAAGSGVVPEGMWNGITLVDVLYLLPTEEQEPLIKSCSSRLSPGGILAVKETSFEPRWKYRLTLAQEVLSVRLFRITAGRVINFAAPASIARWMEESGLAVEARALSSLVHPHHLVAGRRS